ncbi:MAG: uracil-DNA glycosylase [Candidatus Acidiferrum sp.]
MSDSPADDLRSKFEARLRYYEDLGIHLFYKVRPAAQLFHSVTATPDSPAERPPGLLEEELRLRKTASSKSVERDTELTPAPIQGGTPAELFAEVAKIKGDTLLQIREDIGDCTRCKLHKGRNKIVFGDGNHKAKLVFVGEAPGADEDRQGIPFVGRAGKLLTQMIEAMGLKREDVYICNVVKCRPPDNRKPEDDEVSSCSPYLMRQLDVIEPRVLVCLGAVAAQTLLATSRGISQFRGEWMDWHGHKLMATYHPAYLLRNPAAKSEVWKDLQKVMAELGLPLPKKAKS